MYPFCNDVNEWLTVGGDLELAEHETGLSHARVVRMLRARGVTHVLDLRSEECGKDIWVAEGLPEKNHCYVPIIDAWGHEPPEQWYTDVENFVLRFWRESYVGDRLYVHCMMGINRGPSAAMLALLTRHPSMDPFDAFMEIRRVRPVAGLVYAQPIGSRHIAKKGGSVAQFVTRLTDYWTPEMQRTRQQAKWGVDTLTDV